MRWTLTLLALALSGCFSQILPPAQLSNVEFACALLDRQEAHEVIIQPWGVGDTAWEDAFLLADLVSTLAPVSGRPEADFEVRAPRLLAHGLWNQTDLKAWAHDRPTLEDGRLWLRILWLPSLPEDVSGLVVSGGTVALSEKAVVEASARLGVPQGAVARAVLLHHVGHALGAVNNGIPVQNPDIQEREGPAHHEPDPASVMNVGWDQEGTMAWAANATYDSYSDGLLRDWAAARLAGGACR